MSTEKWPNSLLARLPALDEFLPTTELPKRTAKKRVRGLYLLFDGPVVVYVGQSCDIHERLKTHRAEGKKPFTEALWWPCDDESERLRLETILMLVLLPRYNRGLNLGISNGTVWEIRWKRAK